VAQIYVAGPCEIHCGVGANGALAFLGWSESGVRISLNPEWDDVPADLAGSRMPADVQFMGETAMISADLKIWNNVVYASCASRGNPFSGTRGQIPFGQIGGLMITEKAAYRILVYNSYTTKTSQNSFNSWNFFAGWLAGPDVIDPLGTKAAKIRVVFRAIPIYDSLTGNWALYDGSSAGKPAAI